MNEIIFIFPTADGAEDLERLVEAHLQQHVDTTLRTFPSGRVGLVVSAPDGAPDWALNRALSLAAFFTGS